MPIGKQIVLNKHINLTDFAIEVTRRCNMACEHCMRGEAEDMDLDLALARKALEDVRYIDQIVFTGGEPSLNVPCMESVLGICKAQGICVNSFFLATNGKEVTLDFLECLVHWYAYCISCSGDPYMSAVALSRDMFHEDIPYKNRALLMMLSFYDEAMKDTDFVKYPLIGEGRAAGLSDDFKTRSPITEEPQISIGTDGTVTVSSMLYLSGSGDIRTCCDVAYDNDAYTIGNVGEEPLTAILMREAAKENAA